MAIHRNEDYLRGLLEEITKLPRETEWVEFKKDKANPQEIGEYISALANAAALVGKEMAYLVWGIRDKDHAVVGTSFDPYASKVGNEELENWLLKNLDPKLEFRFHEVSLETPDGEKKVVMLEIPKADSHPVRFKQQEYIRVGTYKKNLRDFPEKEKILWRILDQTPFEEGIAAERITPDDVLKTLDYPTYFELLDQPLPENPEAILNALETERLILRCEAGGWNITNLGAILFAKRLRYFDALSRKAIRVVQYRGTDRIETLKEQKGEKGYASGFVGLLDYINGLLPANEVIGRALRKTVPMFPELAIRELVANALIHQDFSVRGAGPMVEIFDGRIEITNPGEPLVDTNRFVDTPPWSRNEKLASLMRRFGICEERGSGIDKVIHQIELFQLPAPLFEKLEGFTKVTLFAHKNLKKMDKEERIRACYLHACLKYVSREYLTNASLRERFGIEERNKSTVSRYIREAVEAGMIKPADEQAARRMMKYVPFWA